MKLLFVFIATFFVDSCKPISQSKSEETSKSSLSKCPEDGVCTFEVLRNKYLEVKTDEFGNTYKNVVNGEDIILKFQYKRNEIPNTEDSGYTEEIYIALDSKEIETNLENSELKRVKLLYGRLCFCRGQTGYYEIDKGILSVVKLDNVTYQLHLEFKCEAVPQIIEVVNETFKL